MCSTEHGVCLSTPHVSLFCRSSWAVLLLALLFAGAGSGLTGFTVILTGIVPFCISHMKMSHVYRSICSCLTCIYVVLHFMSRIIFCDHLYLSMALQFVGPWPLFQFRNLYTVGRTPWTGDQPVARPLPKHRINPHRHPCLEWDSNSLPQCSNGQRRFMP
jgi:hypothetical protein